MATQAEIDKKVQERRAENKKLTAERKKAKRLKKAYKKEAGLKWYQKAPKDIKEKATKKSKAKETGKVRRGAKGVESTKGGEFVKYKKKSKAAKSFRSEFAAARKAGKKAFTWDGRSYSTARADDKKAAPKKVELKKKESRQDAPMAQAGGMVAKIAKKSKDLETKVKAQRAKASAPKAEETKPVEASGEYEEPGNYSKGGKVEGNPYGWPSRDARNGGNK